MEKAVQRAVKIAGIISLVAMAVVIMILAYAASFSVIISDDFFFASDTGRKVNTIQYIAACWKHMAYEYVTWQGAYFSEFFNSLFNPVNIGGFPALRITMMINVILTFGSFIFLIYAVLRKLMAKELWVKCIILGTAVFALAEYDVFAEIFFWYTGAMAVSVPFSLASIALAALILSNDGKKVFWLCVSCTLGLLSAGGSLAIGGTLCYFAIVIILYFWVRDKKLNWSNIIAFLFFFGGSLINAMAPGNFVRQGVESSNSVSVIETFGNVWKVYIGEIEWLFVSNNFGAVICILILCGILIGEKALLDKKAWFISGLFMLFTPAVTIFPVVLGYRVSWIPNRCRFITTQMLILSLGNLALIFGVLLAGVVKVRKNALVIAMAVAALVLIAESDLSPRSYRSIRIIKGLYDHTYQDNYQATRDLMDYFADHPGEDLVVDVPTYPEIIEYYYSFYLIDDETDRINRAVSWAYGPNSVKSSRDYGN